jgi:menaquinol-cytochrome c reductase iron-sulfur subunit
MIGLVSTFVGALLSVPVLRYILYPLTARSDESDWAEARFAASEIQMPLRLTLDLRQRDGWREVDSHPVVYILKTGDQFRAMSAICPHLGCTVSWDMGREQFVCPCHAGAFSPDGVNLSGPPPRPLDALETRMADGKLMVRYQNFRPDTRRKEATL